MKKKLICLLLAFVLVFAAMAMTACKEKEAEPTPTPEKEEPATGQKETAAPVKTEDPTVENPAKGREGADDTLVVGCEGVKGIFSPLYYSSSYDGWLIDTVFEPLFDRDDKGTAFGVLADSWDVSEDNLTFTFHLNKDAKFSNGDDVTAYDVEHTFLALADPSYDGRYGDTVAQLAGYAEYSKEGSTLEKMEGINVIDEDTIAFTFAEVLRTNFNKFQGFGIISKNAYPYTKGDTSTLPEKNEAPVGSGPYVLAQFEPDQFAKVTKNPDHRDADQYAITNIVIKAVESSTELAEVLAGDVDLLPGVVETDKRLEAEASGYVARVEYPRSGFGYLKFNCNENANTADPKVRQALSYAYNQDEVLQVLYEDPATGFLPAMNQPIPMSQVSWGYTESLLGSVNNYDYDPDKATALLDEAGWVVGDSGYREKDGKILEIRVPAMPDHPIWDGLAPLLVDYWSVALNVKLTLEYVEFNTILDYVIYESDSYIDKWDIFFLATTASTYDPDVYYSWFHSKYIGKGQDNTNQYSNAEVDRLLDEARKIIDETEAAKVYEEIYKIINEEQPVQVVYSNLYCDLLNTRVQGMETGPIHDWPGELKDMSFAD